ncbi:dehydrogenase [Aquamicrobium defluvii]|uniref:Dehydrogenase n=1 Tax=Aquamicrobium defluvii TaxID=69279 RepID=A0A011VP38_9HYPH|nr:dehydrogenase [Aquamicrobium defluvii]EZQ16916.1 dehydrogenase [Halopseudomonas bauzanensis]TDR36471.1 putative dehydrogenase [Aquamicrobium defluvii]
MKQILQSLKIGATEVADVPCPAPARGQVLIRTSRTLVSAGTERMLVDFGKAGLIGKARQQPDKVRQVLEKIRTDGLAPTLEAVFNKLDQPLPLGYCNVGRIMEAGPGVSAFPAGERVVSNGKHAEAVAVPVNLCARVPEAVSDDEAAFTVLGAIALQGIRLVQPTLGEAVVVTGLGLIGLMAVQLLRAHGCRVLGIDFDPEKLRLAESFGAETVDLSAGADPVSAAQNFSRGRGVDAVIITASTRSSEPVHQAALMCRKRGRIVLVGVTGLELSRADFYEKELTFQVSCSYGPGRYDPDYEEKGQDYPVGFVRWTEQRNFEAVLDMMADGRLDVTPLISHRFPLDRAPAAYEIVTGSEPSLGILLDYGVAQEADERAFRQRTVRLRPAPAESSGKAAVGFVGSGNYAGAVLVPAFREAGARLVSVASSAGVSGLHVGRKFGFEKTTTDVAELLEDATINAVVIATRHDTHAGLVCRALQAGKHVFVEKPLALSRQELDDVEAARNASVEAGKPATVMVGFNRRFAPQIQKMKTLLEGASGPKAFVMTVNAGAIPAGHWTQDRQTGGGRIVGEACHFIDLLRYLAAAPVDRHGVAMMASPTGDTATITFTFADGSVGSIHYFANGSKSFPKERLEVFAGGRILQLDNFRRLRGFGWPGFRKMNLWRQDKGQKACAAAFVRAVEQGGDAPIPFGELLEVGRITIEIAEAAQQ